MQSGRSFMSVYLWGCKTNGGLFFGCDDDLKVATTDAAKFLMQDGDARIGRHGDGPLDAVVGDEHAIFFQGFEYGLDGW